MQQRHGFGGGGGELRVSLPRVGGPAPAPLSARRGRGGPAGWVVPLPAALLLLALLAVVFQYQLLQCINEADKLVRPRLRSGRKMRMHLARRVASLRAHAPRAAQDVDSQQCRAQLDQAADDLAALRRSNSDLLSALGLDVHAPLYRGADAAWRAAQARWRRCAAC